MKKYPAKTVEILSKAGVVVFIMASSVMGVHFLVMFLESWVIKGPLFLNLEKDFVGTALSAAMIPMICAYAVFAVVAYVLWIKMKKALLEAQAVELRAEKEKVELESTQRLVGVLASHITLYNSEILKWVEYRRSVNKHVPDAVEHASRSMASVVEAMTEAAFLAPYSKTGNTMTKTIEEIDSQLRRRIEQGEVAGEFV